MTENKYLDLIINNIGQGVIALDSSYKILSYNRRIARDLEIKPKVDEPISKIITNTVILKGITEAKLKNSFLTFDYEREDGEIYELRFLPVDESGVRIILVTKVVTEIRKTAKSKQEFFANAGHELNTPLSSIMGYSEMLLSSEKLDPQIISEFSKTINKEATRMKLLIEDMLKLSKLEESKIVIDDKIELKQLVENTLKAISPKADAKNIVIDSNLEHCYIFANEEKIIEVVSNLVDNSVKYTNENGRVKVSLKIKDDKAVLKISDNGKGIPQSSLSRVYERFYRVDKGRSNIGESGTGLGLSIVKHICSHYKASIKLQSKLGVGTTFAVSFTLVD